jgi:hypothetical protein
MHLGISSFPQELIINVIIILVRIFNRIEWFYTNDESHIENQLTEIVGSSLFQELLENSDFVNETLKFAKNEYDSQRYCLLCKQKTLVDQDGVWLCVLCGCKVDCVVNVNNGLTEEPKTKNYKLLLLSNNPLDNSLLNRTILKTEESVRQR